MDLKDILYDFNFSEFEKLDSFESKKDFYSDVALKAAEKNYQILIYASHKRKNKFIKFFILKGFQKRPKTSLEISDFFDYFEFWDNDFRTERSNFIRFLKRLLHKI